MNKTRPNRISTGIQGLDTLLNGGLARGSAYIVTGPPGSGKTIFSNQTCFTVAHGGGRALYVSLLAESHDRMITHMSEMRFFDESLIPNSIVYLSAYSTLLKDGLKGLTRQIFDEMRRFEADVVVIDGLFVARDECEDEKEFRRFVHDMQGQAAVGNCVLLMLTTRERAPGTAAHTMVDGWIEFSDELHGARAVRSVVVHKQRGGPFLRGRHQFRITDDGLLVFPRLEALMNVEPSRSETTQRVGTGIADFDRMIGGGYPAASATILAGPTGTGKTTIGLQFLSQATPEAPGLLYGFYETPARLLTKARSIGIDIDGMLASGALEIIWQSPAENLPDELAERLLEVVKRRSVKRVFLDGIGALRHSFIFEKRLPLFINALGAALRSTETTSVYTLETAQIFMPDNLTSDDLSQMVENVVLTHYVRAPTRIERELLVLKIRDSAFDAFPEIFHICDRGVRFGGGDMTGRRPDGAVSAADGA